MKNLLKCLTVLFFLGITRSAQADITLNGRIQSWVSESVQMNTEPTIVQPAIVKKYTSNSGSIRTYVSEGKVRIKNTIVGKSASTVLHITFGHCDLTPNGTTYFRTVGLPVKVVQEIYYDSVLVQKRTFEIPLVQSEVYTFNDLNGSLSFKFPVTADGYHMPTFNQNVQIMGNGSLSLPAKTPPVVQPVGSPKPQPQPSSSATRK